MPSQGQRQGAVTPIRRATIHDVARLAGVSRQTVSRAVNNKADIDASTKKRILDAVHTLGYRPSRFARGMVRQGSTTLGLVVSDLTNPYFPEVAAGVLDVAEERGWQVVVAQARVDARKQFQALEVLSYQVDAVIGQFNGADDDLARHAGGLPLVLLEHGPDQTRFGSVGIALPDALKELVKHLHRTGHRRVGMLDGAAPEEPSARRAYFVAAARARRMTARVVSCGDHTVEAGEAAMNHLLDTEPSITAVFGFNDLIAIGAIRAARRRGLRVPADIAVAGFDGLTLGALVDPPLTTLAIDKRSLGRLAVEQAAQMLDGKPPSTGPDVWIRPELVIRGSA